MNKLIGGKIDGVKSLTPPQRLALARTLTLEGKAIPVRRSWIPKADSTEQRPLGIPTLHDRAGQALVKSALEPEWEARFEPNSYGFRPGRSDHDAIEAIFTTIGHKTKYVLDADIEKCFDRIGGYVMGRCEPTTGIAPFGQLVNQVLAEELYRSAERLFWIVDKGSSHHGDTAKRRLHQVDARIILVHTPVHAS